MTRQTMRTFLVFFLLKGCVERTSLGTFLEKSFLRSTSREKENHTDTGTSPSRCLCFSFLYYQPSLLFHSKYYHDSYFASSFCVLSILSTMMSNRNEHTKLEPISTQYTEEDGQARENRQDHHHSLIDNRFISPTFSCFISF